MAPDDLKARVAALVAEGRHGEAAELLMSRGQVSRAADLFAAVWRWDRAIEVAQTAGLLDVAYKHALASKDRAACGRILAELEARPGQAVRAAAYAEGKGRLLDAARLREAAGETAAAARLFESAGEYRDAARCRLVLGETRQAGMLYEKRLREDADDAESALALGRILAQFGRWDHAVRALQLAAKVDAYAPASLRLLVACFSAMGMDEAAGSRLDALRELEPELPVTVPAMLERAFGDERGVAALVGQGDSEQLLAGRYRVIGPLGAGATGRVLLAHDAFHDRPVAVKVLNVGGGAVGRDAFVRFGKEARVAAGIDHQNVVKTYEFNPDGPFLVMEYMAGGTLAERLADAAGRPRRYSPLQTFSTLRSVLFALEVVHRRGVVHRDLKPANIFFRASGDVALGDFGVAHLTDLGATLTGAMVGTLAYMAPEQITGSQRPEAATDLYALGIILFRCLTGRLPFRGPDFVQQHLQETPPLASSVVSWIDPAVDAVIERLLAKAPADRPDSAGDLLDLLRGLPWALMEELALADDAAAAPSAPSAPSLPPPVQHEVRYEVLETRADGHVIAHDELLQRSVELVPVPDAQTAARLRAFARADGPYLQAIYEVDEAGGRAVLEHPTGVPLTVLGSRDPRRAAAVSEIRAALGRLHEARVVHGAVRGGKIIVGDARSVLRVHLPTPTYSDPERDSAGLDSLGGHPEGSPQDNPR